MKLISLRMRDFRNLEVSDLAPGGGAHLLLGDNGAGKTSLLEAVYVAATTRSFRTSRLQDCVHHGASGFHLTAEVEGKARTRLEVGWADGDGAEGGLSRSVNGNATSAAEHLEVLPVVAATAEDGEVLTGAPALRRRFLDRGVVATRPSVLDAFGRYRKTLRHKRDLLAQGRRGASAEELDTWNTLLAEAAAEVIALRHAYTGHLARYLDEVVAVAGLPFPPIALRYRPSPAVEWPVPEQEASLGPASSPASPALGASGEEEPPEGRAPSPEAVSPDQAAPPPKLERQGPLDRERLRDSILERLRRSAGAEIRRGQPLLGPHRDDLEILWGGHPVRATVSAGERKALALLLTAAHGRALTAADREPLYLLDDLDAELSVATLARVWEVFVDCRQALVTSNRPSVWQGLKLERRSYLRHGRLVVGEDKAPQSEP